MNPTDPSDSESSSLASDDTAQSDRSPAAAKPNSDAADFSTIDSPMFLLKDDRIIKTVALLQLRINDRFPDCGLAKLCGQLLHVARQAAQRSANINRPIIWIRALGYLFASMLLGVIVGLIVHAVRTFGIKTNDLGFTDFIQTFDAAASAGLFIGAAIYFLIGLERRSKCSQALAAIHELRSIAHIIDMHQLTKDPERFLGNYRGTANSPKEQMTAAQLGRYLDYCTEMLSLVGKIAALYINKFDDPGVVASVGEVEQLTTGLSRKIWQKIIILNQHLGRQAPVMAATSDQSIGEA